MIIFAKICISIRYKDFITQNVQPADFWDIFWATFNEKSLTECSVRDFGGEDENLFTIVRFFNCLKINYPFPRKGPKIAQICPVFVPV